jgi:hypothetical protein
VKGEEGYVHMMPECDQQHISENGACVFELNQYSRGLNMISEYGVPWEESQLIIITFLVVGLGVHSKRTLWYGLSI